MFTLIGSSGNTSLSLQNFLAFSKLINAGTNPKQLPSNSFQPEGQTNLDYEGNNFVVLYSLYFMLHLSKHCRCSMVWTHRLVLQLRTFAL